MNGRELDGKPLDDLELARARHMLKSVLTVRESNAQALRDQLAVEDRAVARLTEEIEDLSEPKWSGLPEDVRKLRSDILRNQLVSGREVFPVLVENGFPMRFGAD